jgi:hypothetical protein
MGKKIMSKSNAAEKFVVVPEAVAETEAPTGMTIVKEDVISCFR